MLGTSRTLVQAGQTSVCYDADFYPFGGERDVVDTCTQNYKFEGKIRDTETGNDDFGARYYTSRLGRWLSADWSAVPAPVPYANLTNPQTLNLYAMVSDNPETFADLDGHDTTTTCTPLAGATSCASTNSTPPPPGGKDPNPNTGTGTGQSTTQTAEQLAAEVPQNVKNAILASVNASNSPTADDKKGGFHEEGGMAVTTDAGQVVLPAVPGPYSKPGDKDGHIDPGKSANPTKLDVKSLDIMWHVHPKGGAGRSFDQPPSPRDLANAAAKINIVVGAANQRFIFITAQGP
jgi:RHS repeat-associated protein